MKQRTVAIILLTVIAIVSVTGTTPTSPNGLYSLKPMGEGFTLFYSELPVAEIASVGITTDKRGNNLTLKEVAECGEVTADYDMLTGKKLHCTNQANEYTYAYIDDNNRPIDLIVRLYNDGLAFRYRIPDMCDERIMSEQTAYRIAEGVPRWTMRWNDAYEGFFNRATSGCDSVHHQWAYPALIEPHSGVFTLFTESDINRHNSASWLENSNDAEMYVVTPGINEGLYTGDYLTPWRVVISGSAADVVESTLVTDLAQPNTLDDTTWIHPGVVSWIYWAYNHGSNDYNIICKYIDMAARLGLPYMLIDAEWDEMKDGKTIDDAVGYAQSQGVKPLIWYNSSTGWIDGAPTPLFRLNNPDDREREFAWCDSIGVAGVKIDFFDGDSQATMDYCIDLLESAARHHLLVNFHGATLPRGWQRTYPHLLTTEAVYGAEWYNNKPVLTARAAAHNATLPFTRNVVGSMDYTPCTFSDSQHPHITTHAHELALTILFESGLQHLADRPESYMAQPAEVQQFFGSLPTVWNETRFISGYPGESVVLARRSGNVWYIAGINGLDTPQTLTLKVPTDASNATARLFIDGEEPHSWAISDISANQLPNSITCLPRGGFVCIIGDEKSIH